jgi:hypothetical protein
MNKLVRDLNEETWDRFAGYCRMHRIKMGLKLSEILDSFFEKNLK